MRTQKAVTADGPNGGAMDQFKARELSEEETQHLKGGDGNENPPPPDDESLIGHEEIVDL
ncbi:MAG: hypothetical protein DHS20C18_40870 [Saprospiraceae bacterium]|nr:MAG: hypothetical protein DHS20C18_40870 [Saprospiraceae bacterium]